MADFVVTPNEVLERGLALVGFSNQRQQNVRREKNIGRFCTHFGAKPNVYAAMWLDLHVTEVDGARIVPGDGITMERFLMTVHFLKCYPKEHESEAIFQLSDRTIRKYTWLILEKIQALMETKIVWPETWNAAFTVTVDGIHCRIGEPQHGQCSKNAAFYSHKFKQAGLAYEVALSIFENKIVWINGPFAAGKNDVSIFRAGLKQKFEVGKLGVADKGYRGETKMLCLPNSHDTPEVREFKGRALARQENVNSMLKNFGCLSNQFRHGIEKHQVCFQAVAVICQFQIENGSPLLVL